MSIYLPFAAFLLSYFLAKIFYAHAAKLGFVAYPNHRSLHDTPTYTGGGIVMVLVFLSFSYLVLPDKVWWLAMVTGTLFLAVIAFIDDRKHISAVLRLFSQIIAVAILYWVAYDYFQQHSILLSLFFAVAGVWFINLFNFMDGIDTLASLEAMIVLLCAVVQMYMFAENATLIPIFIFTVAITAGFLLWNMPPAKLFMGDVGSVSLAFILLALALCSITASMLTIYSWLILLALFWLDASITLLVRIMRRQPWHQAHCTHYYQRWAKQCNSHLRVSLSYMLVNIIWLFPMSCLSLRYPRYGLYCMFVAVCPIAVFFIVKQKDSHFKDMGIAS